MQVSAKTREHPEKVTVEMDIPETLSDLITMYGEEVITSSARASIIIDAQAFLRRNLDKSGDELQSVASTWRPGVRQPGQKKSAFDRAASAISAMSTEERAELLKKLKAMK